MEEFSKTELAQERWKDIFGYDGMYQVSDLGRVRSRNSGEWKVLKGKIASTGYIQVALCKYGKVKYFYVHRLVAQAFIPNSDESKTQINHLNEIKSDNRVSNIEYCTAKYNITYNDLHRRRKYPQHYNCKRRKIEKLYDPDLSIVQNLELFKSNGIECSRNTVNNLRKDLGLTRKYTKAN